MWVDTRLEDRVDRQYSRGSSRTDWSKLLTCKSFLMYIDYRHCSIALARNPVVGFQLFPAGMYKFQYDSQRSNRNCDHKRLKPCMGQYISSRDKIWHADNRCFRYIRLNGIQYEHRLMNSLDTCKRLHDCSRRTEHFGHRQLVSHMDLCSESLCKRLFVDNRSL